MGILIYKNRTFQSNSIYKVVVFSFLIYSILPLLRIVNWIIYPDTIELFGNTHVNFLMYFGLMGIEVVWAILFLVLYSQRVQIRLMESEQRFRAIFENAQEAFGITKEGINILYNRKFLALFGFDDPLELKNKSLLEQIAPEEQSKVNQYIQNRILGKESPSFYETLGIHKNGSVFPMEVQVGSYEIQNEVYTVASIRDITERKMAEKTLKESEELFRTVYENSTIGIYRTTRTGKFYWRIHV